MKTVLELREARSVKSKEYKEGEKAAKAGVKYDACPYKDGQKKLDWSKGHNAARAGKMREEVDEARDTKDKIQAAAKKLVIKMKKEKKHNNAIIKALEVNFPSINALDFLANFKNADVKEEVDENLNFTIATSKAGREYQSRKAKERQDAHKKQDPKHAKTHARNMVDMDKAAAKAKKKGVPMRDYGKDNWKVRNGVKRGKIPEENELQERSPIEDLKILIGKKFNKNYEKALKWMKDTGKSAADAERMFRGTDARELQKMFDKVK